MGWWSATVMGGDTPLNWKGTIMNIALGRDVYDGTNPEVLTREILDDRLPLVLEFLRLHENATKIDTYFGWQVLGVMLMERGCHMPELVRQQVREAINADKWAKEGDKERIWHLWVFFNALMEYDGTNEVHLEEEGLIMKLFGASERAEDAVKNGKLKSYHFSCGDSTEGAVGFCARIRAHSKKEAVQILREAMPEIVGVEHLGDQEAVEYINIYTGTENVTEDDINDEEDVDE